MVDVVRFANKPFHQMLIAYVIDETSKQGILFQMSDIRDSPCREIVDHPHVVALREQIFCKV